VESNPTEADTGSAELQGLKGVSARNGKYSEFRNIPSICCEPASRPWLWKFRHSQLPRYTVGFARSRRIQAIRHRAMTSSMRWCARYPQASLLWRMKEKRPTAPLSTWCTAGRQSDPMRFGKRITPSSISWCSGKVKIRLNHPTEALEWSLYHC
jgi:hypothetical protein